MFNNERNGNTVQVQIVLEMKECYEVINNDERPENIPEGEWKKNELKVKNYIVTSITKFNLELIISEISA